MRVDMAVILLAHQVNSNLFFFILVCSLLSLSLTLNPVSPLNGSIRSKDRNSSKPLEKEHNLNEDQKCTEEGKREHKRERVSE